MRLYQINTGSCGGCDMELHAAVAADGNLEWAYSALDADALVLTGPITMGSREAFSRLLRDVPSIPVLAIGRCAIDGHPFGRGGVQDAADLTVHLRLEGCPPEPKEIANAIRQALLADTSSG